MEVLLEKGKGKLPTLTIQGNRGNSHPAPLPLLPFLHGMGSACIRGNTSTGHGLGKSDDGGKGPGGLASFRGLLALMF